MRGYSRFRCRRCGAPLKDRISILRGYGHECWYKVHPVERFRGVHPPRTQPREYTPPLRPRVRSRPSRTPHRESSKHRNGRSIAKEVLKSAVIGASCSAFPAACPGIVALGQVQEVLSTARAVIERLQNPQRGSRQLAQVILSEIVNEGANRIIGPWTRGIASGIASQIASGGVDKESVRRIATGTISNVMEDGLDGLISWGFKRFG
jgi:hypothetical protein